MQERTTEDIQTQRHRRAVDSGSHFQYTWWARSRSKESPGRVSPHGDFLPWLKANCSFSQRTAYNYIGVYSHSDKIASVASLQEAYQQIETMHGPG